MAVRVKSLRISRSNRPLRSGATGKIFALAGMLALLLGTLSWQWAAQGMSAPDKAGTARPNLPFPTPPAQRLESSTFSHSLRPVTNPRFADAAATERRDPFHVNLSREMIGARGNPFLYAHLSGNSQGRLASKGRANGVLTIGLPVPGPARFTRGRREILENIDSGLGGSFRSFLEKVLGSADSSPEAEAEADPGEENPFLKAIQALEEKSAPPPAATADEAKTEAPQAERNESATEAPAPREQPNAAAAAPATVAHPHLLLGVDENGILRALSAGQTREGRLETSAWSATDFHLLSFTDPAEFPMAMAVADYDSDSLTDLALHIPQMGLIRIYYGNPDGTFSERLRIESARNPSSLAAGDFNRDGWIDLALSDLGNGLLTVLSGDGLQPFRSFRTHWLESYRDYIAVSEYSGFPEILGMSHGNLGTVLVSFQSPDGTLSARQVDSAPALSRTVSSGFGRVSQVQAVVFGTSFSVHVQNKNARLHNVVNVAPGSRAYILLGDMQSKGTLDVSLAVPAR